MTFIAEIQNKELFFKPYNKFRFDDFLSKHEGKFVRLDLIQNSRSLRQNSYYWLCLETIANHTGHSPDELHRLFKGKFLPSKNMKWRGTDYRMAKSTTELTKGEMAGYMREIEKEAGEMGIELPDPKDYTPELK